MYNFALAFVICGVVYFIGEAVSNLTKAWIPSVFVTAAVLLVGFWTVIPTTVVSDSMLIPFGSTIGIYLLITHMGTVISIKQLLSQWKTIVVCLAGLAGMCALCLVILPGVIGRDLVVAGLPPLTGGIIAATTMKTAAEANGLTEAAIFAIAMYCVQGFAGYPLTAVCLQLEGKKLIKGYRAGEYKLESAVSDVDAVNGKLNNGTAEEHKKLIPPLPANWNGPVVILLKLGIVSWLATQLGTIVIPVINMKISGAVYALILGVIFTSIGFLDENAINKANSYGIIMFALMMYVFDGLNGCTPEMLSNIIGPMILLIVVGVAGMVILCFIAVQDPEGLLPDGHRHGLDRTLRFPAQCHHHRGHLHRSGADPGGEGIPDEQDVPAHDRGWLHHCDHHLRGNRRHLCRNVLIQSSAKLSGSFRRTALFTKSLLHIQKKPLQ